MSIFRRKVSHVTPSVGSESSCRVNYPKLYMGAVLSLHSSDGKLLDSAVLKAFSVQELVFARKEGMLSLPVLEPDDIIQVHGRAENGESFALQARVLKASRLEICVCDLELLTGDENRESPRYFVNRPAELSDPNDTRFRPVPDTVQLLDISMTGAHIRSESLYAQDQTLKLRVELYDNAGKISFLSQVIWVKQFDDKTYEYGLLFEEMGYARRKYLKEDIGHLIAM